MLKIYCKDVITWIRGADFPDKLVIESSNDRPTDRHHQIFVGALNKSIDTPTFVKSSGLLQDAHALARLDAVSIIDLWKIYIRPVPEYDTTFAPKNIQL